MRVKRAMIKNFRSLRDVSIEFGQQTALVGGNGAGKSSVLRAVELFYAASLASIRDIDFYDASEPIEIALTFSNFTTEETELFASRISGDEMTVVRTIEANGGRSNGRYFGMTQGHVGFDQINKLSGAPKKTAFNDLCGSGIYSDLEKVGRIDEIDESIASWTAKHPEQCSLVRDNGQFFGFSNVGRGALQKATSFVLIPAIRDAGADAQDGKNTPVGQLMELIVRSAIQSRSDIKAFQKEISERYAALTDPKNLPELGGLADAVTDTLTQLYSDVAVTLSWKATEAFGVPLPGADVGLKDEDVETPVDRAGHGLQRAFIIALLQHLARARATETNSDGEPNSSAPSSVEPASLPGLILAIEEPELYQHPTKQRHLAQVLTDLSRDIIPGMATSTQLMFATHSPYFVAMERFDEIRIVRRIKLADRPRRESDCSAADYLKICEIIENANGEPAGTFSPTTIRPRLHIMNSELSEGFFAKAVVLVEGTSDRAALMAVASQVGADFEAAGIAILPVGGKENLDKPWAVFSSLGIPTYVIWDSDINERNNAEKHKKSNRALQRLVGSPGAHADFPMAISDKFACFEDKLETTLKGELTEALFNRLATDRANHYGLRKPSHAAKNPAVMTDIMRLAADAGASSPTLNEIIRRVFLLVTHP